MKLLIIDDQPSVVQGLLHGVDWKAMGFSVIDTAYSADDAKRSLLGLPAQVMLCDIEMPGQSGLELLQWVREQQMDTRCIFLTAFAKFDYAREAVRLGGFDYIVQPAPYEQIAETVRKALLEITATSDARALQELGRLFDKNSRMIQANAVRNVLLGLESPHSVTDESGTLPILRRRGWLVLLQVLEYEGDEQPWPKSLLEYALQNITNEIFEPLQSTPMVFSMLEDQGFALVLLQEKNTMVWDEVFRQLLYLQNVCKLYMGISTAMYLEGSEQVCAMGPMWQRLLRRCENNVTKTSGILKTDVPVAHGEMPLQIPQMEAWKRLLQNGYSDAMAQEACAMLDKRAAEGRLDADSLLYFYREFMQMLFSVLDHSSTRIHDLFSEPESMELYRNGMKSVHNMKNLILHVAARTGTVEERESGEFIPEICSYIAAHLESELRREELAELVHLNPDYLTRRFKKEMGMSLREYVIEQKMQEARALLRTTGLPISFVAAKVGYSNFSHFSNSYKKQFGVTPQEDRQK